MRSEGGSTPICSRQLSSLWAVSVDPTAPCVWSQTTARRTALSLRARDKRALSSMDQGSHSCTASVRHISSLPKAGARGPWCASCGTKANAPFTFVNSSTPVLGAVETTRFCTVGPSVAGQITRWHMKGRRGRGYGGSR